MRTEADRLGRHLRLRQHLLGRSPLRRSIGMAAGARPGFGTRHSILRWLFPATPRRLPLRPLVLAPDLPLLGTVRAVVFLVVLLLPLLVGLPSLLEQLLRRDIAARAAVNSEDE